MPATTTIRVHEGTRDTLRRLAGRREQTIPELVGELARRADEDQLLEDFRSDCERVERESPTTWAELEDERSRWDATLSDGLRDDPWPSTPR